MEQQLGMQWVSRSVDEKQKAAHTPLSPSVHGNARVSLWPERWPAIAKQECVDQVEAAPPERRAEIKFLLPCHTCDLAGSCLNAKRKELGSLMYDREIMTSPRTSESSLFPRTLMEPMLLRSEACQPHWRKPFGLEHQYAVVQAWDLAWSEKTGGDWLVCMTAYVNVVSGRRRLLDVQRWRQKTFDQQIELIKAEHAKFQADLVVIEGDAAQAIWKQQVDRTTQIPVVSHYASDGKNSLQIGVPSLLIKFENKKWEFPYLPGSLHFDQMEAFLNELEAFGWVDGKLQGVGEHDDTVMCFWHLDWGIDKMILGGPEEFRRGMQDGKQA